ncbi:type II toxin-antitoxin system RelE/ParE family toxin [Patescibacteria group bacterium]|nr:type II toxin-antitoxin system RelE/ParE family toxin [Patescibacteria group bacterium]
MSKFEVRFSDKGWKKLQRLGRTDVKRVIKKVAVLREYPSVSGDVKKMSGTKLKLYRLRIGDIRAIFEVDGTSGIVWIIGVDYRGRVYRGW